MSLYLKYRPSDLTQVRGNADVVASLEGMLSSDECPHVFLLYGPTGCGKTTVGRIIASRVGCKGDDFREVDSADFRGIDTVREIRKKVSFKAMEGDVRVWLIDECHKMTNDAQNALLKILEDTPPHTYFILCTTEPQKLLATVKGRCQQFQLLPLSDTQMLGLLRRVVSAEKQELEKEIYEQIITSSKGHPRNALQILEQVLNVAPEARLNMAKKAEAEVVLAVELCRALIQGAKWKVVAGILASLKDQEPEDIRRVVLGYAQAILLRGAENDLAAAILEAFYEPTYNIGMPGIVFACYSVTKTK